MFDGLHVHEHAPCLFDDAHTRRRGRDLGFAELALELLCRDTQCWLAYKAGLGGASEMTFVADVQLFM